MSKIKIPNFIKKQKRINDCCYHNSLEIKKNLKQLQIALIIKNAVSNKIIFNFRMDSGKVLKFKHAKNKIESQNFEFQLMLVFRTARTHNFHSFGLKFILIFRRHYVVITKLICVSGVTGNMPS